MSKFPNTEKAMYVLHAIDLLTDVILSMRKGKNQDQVCKALILLERAYPVNETLIMAEDELMSFLNSVPDQSKTS